MEFLKKNIFYIFFISYLSKWYIMCNQIFIYSQTFIFIYSQILFFIYLQIFIYLTNFNFNLFTNFYSQIIILIFFNIINKNTKKIIY